LNNNYKMKIVKVTNKNIKRIIKDLIDK